MVIPPSTLCVRSERKPKFLKILRKPLPLPSFQRALSHQDIPCWLSREDLRPHLNAELEVAPTPRVASAFPLQLPEAVKGYILDKNSCFDFTWLNNKSSRRRQSRQENKAQRASPDVGGSALQPVGSADWLASRMAQEY